MKSMNIPTEKLTKKAIIFKHSWSLIRMLFLQRLHCYIHALTSLVHFEVIVCCWLRFCSSDVKRHEEAAGGTVARPQLCCQQQSKRSTVQHEFRLVLCGNFSDSLSSAHCLVWFVTCFSLNLFRQTNKQQKTHSSKVFLCFYLLGNLSKQD